MIVGWIDLEKNTWVEMYFCISVFVGVAQKNLWITKSTSRKKIKPTKYPWEKDLDPQNTHQENLGTHDTPTRKTFRPTNTHEENIGPTKYPREKISDPWNTHEGIMALNTRDIQWRATDEIYHTQNKYTYIFKAHIFNNVWRKRTGNSIGQF